MSGGLLVWPPLQVMLARLALANDRSQSVARVAHREKRARRRALPRCPIKAWTDGSNVRTDQYSPYHLYGCHNCRAAERTATRTRVLQADFGPALSALTSFSGLMLLAANPSRRVPLLLAQPPHYAGAVVLIQRDNCHLHRTRRVPVRAHATSEPSRFMATGHTESDFALRML